MVNRLVKYILVAAVFVQSLIVPLCHGNVLAQQTKQVEHARPEESVCPNTAYTDEPGLETGECLSDVPAEEKDKKLGVRISTTSVYILPADLDHYDGGYSVARTGFSIGYDRLTFNYGRQLYFWNDVGNLPFGNGLDDPWESIHTLGLTAKFKGKMGQRWNYFLQAGTSTSFEKEIGELGFKSLGGLGFAFSKKMMIYGGAAVFYHPVRLRVIPVGAFRYGGEGRSDSGLSVSVGLPETSVSYRFNTDFAAKFTFFYDSDVVRLANDSTVQRKGWVETQDMAIGLLGGYTPTDHLSLWFGGGYAFLRDLQIYNSDGDRVAIHDVGESPYLRFLLKYEF